MLVSENGTSSSFEVVLTSQPTDDVTITVSTLDNTEGTIITPFVADSDKIAFTNGNWNIPQTVTVAGVDDSIADTNQVFTIELGITASVGDLLYDGTIDPPDVSFTNVDDDIKGITVDIDNGLITSESGVLNDTFTVVLNSEPTADVTISVIASQDVGEVTVDKASLTFTTANWSNKQTVTVSGVDDVVIDASELTPVTIDLGTATGGGYTGLIPEDVTVYNLDDEIAPQILKLVTPWGYVTTENGGYTEIIILLSSAPANDVTLNTIQSLDGTEGNVMSPPSITFTPANWNVMRYIRVQGVPDGGRGDGDVAYTVDLGTTTSLDPDFNGIDPGDVTVTNKDYEDITWYNWDNTQLTNFSSISGTGNLIMFNSIEPATFFPEDEGFAYVPIGFNFYFCGRSYDSIMVNVNGYASLNPNPNLLNHSINQMLFVSEASHPSNGADQFINVFAPWFDDLEILDAGNDVYFETKGLAPNRQFIIEWDSVKEYSQGDTFSFQIILYEGTNVIEFVYGPVTTVNPPNGSTASIAVRQDSIVDGTDNYYIQGYDGLYGDSAAGYNIALRETDFPVLNTNYRFSPP
jgi:hypothetical protein